MTSEDADFDLLQYLHLSSLKDEAHLSAAERLALSAQQHREVDEAQYVGHLLQDKVSRLREQFSIRGRTPVPRSYTRDATDKYGYFWFGQGKYEEDEKKEDEERMRRRQREEQTSDDATDGECWRVLRPREAPPPPRSKSRTVGNSAGSSHRPARAHASAPRSQPNPSPAVRSSGAARPAAILPTRGRAALQPPWAEHYSTDAAPQPAAVADWAAGPLPRGRYGIDAILQRARGAQDLTLALQHSRLRADRRHRQRTLRGALDAQVDEQRRRKLALYEADLVQQYGVAMRHILRDTFGGQAAESARLAWAENGAESEEESEASRRAPPPPRAQRARAMTAEDKARHARQAWLAAWEEHRSNLATQREAQLQHGYDHNAREARQMKHREYPPAQLPRDEKAIPTLHYRPSVLHYSDELLAAERRRREGRLEYSAALDEQRRKKATLSAAEAEFHDKRSLGS